MKKQELNLTYENGKEKYVCSVKPNNNILETSISWKIISPLKDGKKVTRGKMTLNKDSLKYLLSFINNKKDYCYQREIHFNDENIDYKVIKNSKFLTFKGNGKKIVIRNNNTSLTCIKKMLEDASKFVNEESYIQ